MSRKVHQSGGEVVVEEGLVIVDGLSAVMASFTPNAADEIGHKLIDAAARASDPPAPHDVQPKG